MEKPSTYADLSLLAEKAIDTAYLLNKIKGNGYSIVALDQQVSDPKQIKTKAEKIEVEGLKTISRITLIVEHPSSLHPLTQQQVPYPCDIMAIKPLNEKVYHSVCTEYDSYDIITFDIANKMPFMLKRNPTYEAIRKGKFFEIYYDPVFDDAKRVVAMTNMVNIIKATGGKNLIVSSHAHQNSNHRTPYDVAALLLGLGLDKNRALATMKQNCHEVIQNGQHRLYLKGAIQQIPVSIALKLNKRIQKHKERIKMIRNKLKETEMRQEPK